MGDIMEKAKKIIYEIISYIIIIVVVIFIKNYVMSPIKVNGNSMYNTLQDKDIMLLNEFVYRFLDIERFDIVVVKEEGELLIKRVIGLPNDRIKCVDGVIYVNDEKLVDEYAYTETSDFLEVVLENDEYFVLGDNRDVSLDSRTYGAYKREEIKGRASFVIYPFNRFGSVK